MADLICTCNCGHKAGVSEYMVGMMIRCAQCGRPVHVSEANTVPADTPPRNRAHEARQSAPFNERPRRCARCGKALRGDWDRYTADEGDLCHVCANIAGAAPVGAQPVAPPPARNVLSPGLTSGLRPAGEGEPERNEQRTGWFDELKRTRAFRIGLWTAALGTIALAVILSVTDSYTPVHDRGTVEQTRVGLGLLGPAETLTRSEQAVVDHLVRALQVLFWYAACFAALYVTLVITGNLPCDTLWKNALHVAVVALIVRVAVALVSFAFGFFLPIGGLLGFALVLYLLYEVYALRLADLVLFVLVSWLFGIVFAALGQLIFGGLGLLLF